MSFSDTIHPEKLEFNLLAVEINENAPKSTNSDLSLDSVKVPPTELSASLEEGFQSITNGDNEASETTHSNQQGTAIAPQLPPKPKSLQSSPLKQDPGSGWIRIVGNYRRGVLEIVLDELRALGFRLAPREIPDDDISIYWSRSFFHMLPKFKPIQRVNWMPGMYEVCRKDLLGGHIMRAKANFGAAHFSFWPNSFNLPMQFRELMEEFTQRPVPYILKPPMAARGEGIRLMTKVEDVDLDSDFIQTKIPLAQQYVMNPLLFNGKYKMTFRFYVALTSVDPLRLYIFKDGLVRICSTPYTTEMSSFENLLVHLTNYDLHVVNESNFVQETKNQTSGVELDGLRAGWIDILRHLTTNGVDTDLIWLKIQDVVVKSFIAAEQPMTKSIKTHVKYRGTSFEVTGFDILLDDQYNPWLLEVNHTPSLCPHTDLENKIKHAMLRDLFQLVDIQKHHHAKLRALHNTIVSSWKPSMDNHQHSNVRLSDETSSAASTAAIDETSSVCSASSSSSTAYLGLPFPVDEQGQFRPDQCTKSDLWGFLEAEFESRRTGGWDCCYPNPSTSSQYIPLLMTNRTHIIALWQQHLADGNRSSVLKQLWLQHVPTTN